MNKQKVTSNDVLEALSIRLNDTIRPNRNKDKKNNAYFWIFKFAFLLIYAWIIALILNTVIDIGVFFIYEFAVSLRSVLSALWIAIISSIKNLALLYLFYSQFKIFVTSDYYKELYRNEKKMKKTKKTIEKVIGIVFKVIAVCHLVLFGTLAVLALMGFFYVVCMFIEGMYIVSLALIFLSIFGICALVFRHVKKIYLENKVGVKPKYVIGLFCALIFSIGFLLVETSSFSYSNTLPAEFTKEKKETIFNINEDQKVYFYSDSKLDNIKLKEDETLIDQIRVEVVYYKTARVSYVSTFNAKDDLKITITSDLISEKVDGKDIFKLFAATANDRTIYNYNLFKYPNVEVYANPSDFERIIIK